MSHETEVIGDIITALQSFAYSRHCTFAYRRIVMSGDVRCEGRCVFGNAIIDEGGIILYESSLTHIEIRTGLAPRREVWVWVHELTHLLLHREMVARANAMPLHEISQRREAFGQIEREADYAADIFCNGLEQECEDTFDLLKRQSWIQDPAIENAAWAARQMLEFVGTRLGVLKAA